MTSGCAEREHAPPRIQQTTFKFVLLPPSAAPSTGQGTLVVGNDVDYISSLNMIDLRQYNIL